MLSAISKYFANKNENVKNSTTELPLILFDEKGQQHKISKKIGQGGQGAVYKTKDKNVIIKLVLDESTGLPLKNENFYNNFKNQINEIRIIEIPKELHIAKPVNLLAKPLSGYTMLMLSGMIPISNLIIPKNKKLSEFYLETGGLKRRLTLLKELSKTIAYMQSNSLVYADISPNNIFISEKINDNNLWLIDPDNIRHEIDFNNSFFTPGYGAPEIYTGKMTNTTFSDSYTFAVLAFEVLALLHPFEGELVINGGGGWDDDDDEDYQELAYRGEIPWVDDINDDENFSDKGIPRDIILSNKMKELFQQTFSYNGRAKPMSRPSMLNWYDVLKQAEAMTINCGKCNSTYFANKNNCPFCGCLKSKYYFINVVSVIEDIETKTSHKKTIYKKIININENNQIYKSEMFPHLLLEDDQEILTFSFKKTKIYIKNAIQDSNLYIKKNRSFEKFNIINNELGNDILIAHKSKYEILYVYLKYV